SEKVVFAHKSVNILIARTGEIKATSEDTPGGRMFFHNESQLKLGSSDNSSGWRVVDKNKLMNVTDFITFRRAILVTTAGRTCTAQVDYELKPGFSDYRY